jgi:hypothetical protein
VGQLAAVGLRDDPHQLARARSDGSADVLSDYDVIVAVRDAADFAATDQWAFGYGRPLVRWGDQRELYGMTTYFRGVVSTRMVCGSTTPFGLMPFWNG